MNETKDVQMEHARGRLVAKVREVWRKRIHIETELASSLHTGWDLDVTCLHGSRWIWCSVHLNENLLQS